MPARYDAKLGKVVFDEDELGNPVTDPSGLNPEPLEDNQFKLGAVENPLLQMAADKAEADELAVQQQAVGDGLEDNRPFISGGTVTDLLKAPIDVGAGLATDLVDLGSGLVDVARATASSAGLGEFGWDQVFDDRDNPLTQFRRDTVGNYDTKLGETIGTTGRIASFFIGGKFLYKAPKLASKIGQLSRLVGAVPGLSTAYRSSATAQRLAKGAAAANKAAKGTKAFRIASKNPYLTTTFKDIANAPEVAGWWKNSVNSFRAVKGMGKAKVNPRNLAETLAMDIFASFNVFGEGNDGMDETLFDMFDDVGVEVPEALLQSPLDSGFDRKWKGMLDGTLFSFIGGGLVDLYRIGKFRRAFDAASEVDKKEIRKAFLDSYEELGNGVGSMLSRMNATATRELGPGAASQLDPFGRQPLNDGREAFYGSEPFSGAYDPFDTPGQLARLEDVRAQNQSFELAETQAQVNARSAIEEVNVRTQAFPEQPRLMSSLDADAVVSARVRVDEPTVSPGGISDAVERSMANGVPPEQIVRDVQRLMPRKNVDLIDYIKMNPPRRNGVGMIRASDQIWSDYILKKGLSEGWVRLDDDFSPVFIRSAAYEADAAGLIEQQAKALDELQQIRDFEVSNSQVREQSGFRTPQAGEEGVERVATDLDPRRQELRGQNRRPQDQEAQALDDALRRVEPLNANAERLPVRDPAALAAEADAINAAKNEDALSDQEFARLAKNVVAEDPDQLIRDQLRVDPLQADESVTVVKAETGRGWEVYDQDGELYQNGRFTTKRAAEKFAAKQRKALKDDLAKRAQQVADDDAGELIEYGTMEFARDGDLLGDVNITGPQLKALQELGIEGLPEKAGKATFTQAQMSDIVSQAMQASATGNKGRVLNRIIENFDVAVRELEPQVRIQRQSQKLIEQTKRVLNHGDYCP